MALDYSQVLPRLRDMQRYCDQAKYRLQDMESELMARRRQRLPLDEATLRDASNRAIDSLVDAFEQVLRRLSGKQEVDRPTIQFGLSALFFAFLEDHQGQEGNGHTAE